MAHNESKPAYVTEGASAVREIPNETIESKVPREIPLGHIAVNAANIERAEVITVNSQE